MRSRRRLPRNSSRRKLGCAHSVWREASATSRDSRSLTAEGPLTASRFYAEERRPRPAGAPVLPVTLVAENDGEERAVHVQATVVMDEAHLPEPVHEVADPRSGRADHGGEGLLTDLRDDGLRLRFLPEVREEQEEPSQSLLAGVEELIHQILFDPDVAGEQVGDEELGELRLPVEEGHHGFLADAEDGARLYRVGGGHAEGLTGQATLTEEVARLQYGDDRLFPMRGQDGQFHLAAQEIEDRVRGVALRENGLPGAVVPDRLPAPQLGEEDPGIEIDDSFARRRACHGLGLPHPKLLAGWAGRLV